MREDIKLSNIKGLLIFLVVFGHLLAPYQDKFNGIYLFIYSFHMPLFILVTGYFAKRITPKKIINLVLLYLIFQTLYRIFLYYLKSKDHFKLLFELPYYHLWFLVSLTFWYGIAYMAQKLSINNRYKVLLVIILFLIGVVSRLYAEPVVNWLQSYNTKYDTYTLSYQRTLTFLPFFFIGLFLTKDQMQKLYHQLKNRRWVSVITITLVFIYFMQVTNTNMENILKGSYGLNELKGPLWPNTLRIIMCYSIAILLCYMLLNLISSRRSILTKWGNRTMPVFLFHIFITRIIKDIDSLYTLSSWILFPLLLVASILIVVVLSSELFMKYSYYLWHPYDAVRSLPNLFRTGMQPSN